jgi:tetratricopeptide (TPR) repeat protein
MSELVRLDSEHPSLGELLDLALGTSSDADLDREAVLDHLGACADCERTFRDIVADQESARAGTDLELDADGLPIRKGVRSVRAGAPRRWAAVIPLAAAAVLAFILIGMPRSPADAELSLTILPTPENELRLRDANGGGDADLLAGLQAYMRAEYATAIDLLQAADVDAGEDLVLQVYLGSALAQSGRYAEARVVLERLDARTLPDPWGSEALWTLVVVYQRLKLPDRADALLSELAADAGEVGDRARDALERRALS